MKRKILKVLAKEYVMLLATIVLAFTITAVEFGVRYGYHYLQVSSKSNQVNKLKNERFKSKADLVKMDSLELFYGVRNID